MEESTNRFHSEQDQHVHTFKGVEYLLQLVCDPQSLGGALRLVVEERFTCESWMGVFEPAYVEELSRRTGNYKPFGVFTAMLQAALAGTNPAVKIDLLTYADLETLRQRKLESNSGRGLGQNPGSSSGQNHAKLKNKRYLIMTFTSEFDRVHYPLPLEYQGEPRAGRLQGIIRTLTQDLSEALEGQRRTAAALVELQRTHEHVCGERNALQRDVASLQQTLTTTHAGGEAPGSAQAVLPARQEAAVLKKVIAKLETDLLSERTKFQKALQKKTTQVHDLTAENALLRDAERSLQARCRNLAGETSIRRTRQASLRGGSGARRRSESAERRQAARAGGQISPFHTSRGKLNSPLKASGDSTSRGRQRTSPATAQSSSAERLSRGQRASVRLRGRAFSRSPSPGRFDPTEYVRAREEKLQAVRAAREADRRRARSASPRPRTHEPRPRSSSGSRRRTHAQSHAQRQRSASPPTHRVTATSPTRPRLHHPLGAGDYDDVATTVTTVVSGTPPQTARTDTDNTSADHQTYFKRNAEITDIDARLQALQAFLKSAHGAG